MSTNQFKWGYASRKVSTSSFTSLMPIEKQPEVGDLGAFRVISIGKSKRLHNRECVNQQIFLGDLIIAAFGNRYASNQFEGYVPQGKNRKEFDLLSQGGVVGEVASAHIKFDEIGPTKLEFLGYLSDGKHILNTIQEPRQNVFIQNRIPETKIILSLGSSMDSGKTTSAAYLIHGLKKAGKRSAYIKMTGTTYSKDKQLNLDMGADIGCDFSDLGYPSTYLLDLDTLKKIFFSLVDSSMRVSPDYIIVEIADGILQRETKALLSDKSFLSNVDGVLLSVLDSLGAKGALPFLEKRGISPLALAGKITTSPLMIKEAKEFVSQPIWTLADLASPEVTLPFLESLVKPQLTRLSA